jgi:hypothetical protein
MRFVSLLVAVVLAALQHSPAEACGPLQMDALIRMSSHVALVRVVARHEVKGTQVVEYEVAHVFHGDPPHHFAVFDPPEQEAPQPGAPQPTDWALLFLTEDPHVSASWSAWEALARFTAEMPVLASMYSEPVLLSDGQLGVVSEVLLEPPYLLDLLGLEPPAPAWMPLETYTDAIERKVERVLAYPESR